MRQRTSAFSSRHQREEDPAVSGQTSVADVVDEALDLLEFGCEHLGAGEIAVDLVGARMNFEHDENTLVSFADQSRLFQLWWLRERDAVHLDVESSGPFGNNYEDARWELVREVAAVHLVGGAEQFGA